MTLLDASARAECFGIQAKRQSPTLSLLYHILQTLNEQALVISSFEKKHFKKITNAKNIAGIEQHISVINLRTNWKEKKQKYSYEFIYIELEHIISKSTHNIIVLHGVGDFFELHDGNEVEAFVDTVIQLCAKAHKKLIYTIDTDQALSKLITKAFHHHLDLEVLMKQEDAKRTLLHVNYSIESIKYNNYRFIPQTENSILEPLASDEEKNIDTKIQKYKPRVILTGDDNYNLHRLAYLFDNEIFDLEIVDSTMATILGKLMSNPHLLIYATSESFYDATHYELCNSAKEQNLQTSIVYITGRSFIRNSDKRLAGASYCGDLFERDFNIEAFITSIEKIIGFAFYSDTLAKLETPESVIDINTFISYKKMCLKKHIFFTQLRYRYIKMPPSKKSLESILSRLGDCASVIKSEKTIILLLLNTSMTQADIFTQKMQSLDVTISFIEVSESTSFHE